MRDYGKVHISFWSSQTISGLSDDGKILALYLLTCQHGTMVGAFRLPDGYACDDLNWGSERLKTTLSELFANGFCNRCETTKWIWINKHFEWNKPENPNQIKCAVKLVEFIPDECSWKADYIRLNAELLGLRNETVIEPLANPIETSSSNSSSNSSSSSKKENPLPNGKRTRKQKIPIPENFGISDRVKKWASEKGHTRLEERLEHFIGKSKSNGYVYIDWDEAFMTSVRSDWAKLPPLASDSSATKYREF